MASGWPRCGGAGGNANDVETLRRGLARAEAPFGTLRGSTRRPPNPAARITRAGAAADSNGIMAIAGTQANFGIVERTRHVPRQTAMRERHEKALDLRRMHKVVRFTGSETPALPEGWSCAICLAATWDKQQLSRMPRCEHIFHTRCVDKWFLRSADCPYCRLPV